MMGFPIRSKFLLGLLAGSLCFSAVGKELKKSEVNRIIPEGEYLVKSGKRVRPHAARTLASNDTARPKKKISRHPVKTMTKHHVAQSKASHPTRHLASKSKAKSKSKPKAKGKAHAKHPAAKPSRHKPERRHAARPKAHRYPVARETPNERDMPFVSIPHRKVSHIDRTIVMDDPAVKAPLPKPRRVGAALKPDGGVLDPSSDGPPSEVGEAKAAALPPVVGPAPASVGAAPDPEMAAPAAPTGEAEIAHAAAETATREPDAFDLHSGADPMHGP